MDSNLRKTMTLIWARLTCNSYRVGKFGMPHDKAGARARMGVRSYSMVPRGPCVLSHLIDKPATLQFLRAHLQSTKMAGPARLLM